MKTITHDGLELREIPGHPGYYVSESGVAVTTTARWSPKKRRLAQNPSGKRGYLAVSCGCRRVAVHRAVAMAWIPNPGMLPQVNHIDGNKMNNDASNLEWCTLLDNVKHQLETGLHDRPEQPVIGVNHKTGDGVLAKSHTSAAHFGFNRSHISACVRGDRLTHKSFKWAALS